MTREWRTEKNRARYRTVAFRMSDYELAELNERVYLSGRQKQDYLIRSVLYQQVVVVGNQMVFNRLGDKLGQIAEQLIRIEKASDLDDEILAPIRTAIDILNGFRDEAGRDSDRAPLTSIPASDKLRYVSSSEISGDVKMMSRSPKTGGNTNNPGTIGTRKRW